MSIYQLSTTRRRVLTIGTLTVISVLLPLVMHSLPPVNGVRTGARLLPMFYTPLLAFALTSPPIAIAIGLLAPFLNHWIVGTPPLNLAALLAFEIGIFSLFIYLFRRFDIRSPIIAPIAFVLAKFGSFILLTQIALVPAPPAQYALNSISTGWVGIIILLLLQWVITNRIDERA